MCLLIIIIVIIYFVFFFLSAKDFVSLDGFLGDISDEEVRHRKSSSHRGPPGRRKPEKVVNSEFYQWSAQLAFLGVLFLLSFIYGGVLSYGAICLSISQSE